MIKENKVCARYVWTISDSLCISFILNSPFRLSLYSYTMHTSDSLDTVHPYMAHAMFSYFMTMSQSTCIVIDNNFYVSTMPTMNCNLFNLKEKIQRTNSQTWWEAMWTCKFHELYILMGSWGHKGADMRGHENLWTDVTSTCGGWGWQLLQQKCHTSILGAMLVATNNKSEHLLNEY